MTEARNVLTAQFTFDREKPLDISAIPGLRAAVEHTYDTKERELVRCEDRTADYDVYWNGKTETVRIAAVVPGAAYEVPDDAIPEKE